MTISAPVQQLTARRYFLTLLCFNIPLIVLFVAFNSWRAYIHADGAGCADYVCAITARYGDDFPLVASLAEEIAKSNGKVNVALARELLFFNVIFCIAYTPVATILFCVNIAKHGPLKKFRYGKAALMMPVAIGFLAFMLFIIGWDSRWSPAHGRGAWKGRLILDYWAGAFIHNGRSLTFSVFTMMVAFYLLNLAQFVKRRFGAPETDRR